MYIGLFGLIRGGIVQHVTLENVNISGYHIVGGLVGSNQFGMIYSTSVSGIVTGVDRRVGGLIGWQKISCKGDGGAVQASYTHVEIITNSAERIGGLIGLFEDGSVGLIGKNSNHSNYRNGRTESVFGYDIENTIEPCGIMQNYATGRVEGAIDMGGIFGMGLWDETITPVTSNYWDVATTGLIRGGGESKGSKGLTTDQMTGQNAYIHMYELDFDETWQLTDGYPVLAWQETDNAVDQPEVPIVRVAPKEEEYNYGEVATDSSTTRSYTLRNSGNTAMSGEVSMTGTHDGAFEIIRGEGHYTLEPDSSRVIEVEFRPATADTFQATLEIRHDAPNRDNPLTISLKGTGKLSTSVDQERQLPRQPELHQNHPNPFNPVTTIRYDLPEQMEVRLEIFDILGRRVATLVDEEQRPGTHHAVWDASQVASGVYIYQIRAGDYIQSRQLTVIK